MIGFDMSEQLAALIIQGLIGLLMLAIGYFVRRAWKAALDVLHRIDHLDECQDKMRIELAEDREEVKAWRAEAESRDNLHRADARERDQRIANLQKDYAGLEGWVKGWARLAIDKPITDIDPKNGVS